MRQTGQGVRRWLFLVLLICMTSSGYADTRPPNGSLSRADMRADLQQALELLERYHPNFALHRSADDLRRTFEAAQADLPTQATRLHFLRFVLAALGQLQDGHTCAQFSSPDLAQGVLAMPLLPLALQQTRAGYVVSRKQFGLPKGSLITHINQEPFSAWLDRASAYLCGDGDLSLTEVDPKAQELLYFLWMAHPDVTDFHVRFVTPNGTPMERDLVGIRGFQAELAFSPQETIDFHVIDGIPVLTINSFLGERADFEPLLDRIFAELRSLEMPDLVLDLRENRGGVIANASLLLAYLLDTRHHFPRYIHVSGNPVLRKHSLSAVRMGQDHRHQTLGRDSLDGTQEGEALRKANNKVQLRYKNFPSAKTTQPRGWVVETARIAWGKQHYQGRLHVLISGRSFSATSLFVGELRRRRDAVFYGSTTGGLENRGCLRAPFNFTLTHSNLELSIPLICHIQELEAKARNFEPDIRGMQSIQDFLDDKDRVLRLALDAALLAQGRLSVVENHAPGNKAEPLPILPSQREVVDGVEDTSTPGPWSFLVP